MSYELDERFIARITAPIRTVCEHAPVSLQGQAGVLLHGTTIGAFMVDDGQAAIAFSDGKVSMANKPVHMAYRKILSVDRYTRLLISGSPSVGFAHAGALKAWVGYREDTSNQPVSARAKARFLARLLMGSLSLTAAGIICMPILATYDVREKKCARIFSLGPDGSEVEHSDWSTSGSGADIDVWFRKAWRTGLTVDEGIALARDTIKTLAPDIDSFSGGKVSIDVIGPDGARTVE